MNSLPNIGLLITLIAAFFLPACIPSNKKTRVSQDRPEVKTWTYRVVDNRGNSFYTDDYHFVTASSIKFKSSYGREILISGTFLVHQNETKNNSNE